MNNTPSSYSNFWDTDSSSISVDEFLGLSLDKPKGKDPIKLASYKRAISNFVNILTGKSIPVSFRGDDSYTDGKTINISANINEKNFDPTVGLALHEAAHNLMTDFDSLKNLEVNIPAEFYVLGDRKGLNRYQVQIHIKNMLNYVEDRRIDNFIFTTSPGYKGYYHEMYNKFFYSKTVDKMLLSTELRLLDIESYEARIINLHNKNTQLTALPGLREIYSIIDLKNIGRLKSTSEAFDVACDVFKVILTNIDSNIDENSDDKNSDNENSDSENSEESSSGGTGGGDENSDEDGDDENSSGGSGSDDNSDANTTNDDGSDAVELTDRQKDILKKHLDKQGDFMDGNVQKTKASKKLQSDVSAIESSGATYEQVGTDINHWNAKSSGVKCIVIKKLTKMLIDTDQFSVCSSHNGRNYTTFERFNFVEEGLRLGNILGKKLQIRGEENSLKFTRKGSGRLDKRLISELGFGNSNVFSQTFIEKYNKAYLHISVDASGSMYGTPWNKAMTSAVAMIKACDMVGNIEVVMSVRTTHGGHSRSSDPKPLIVICYDSRVDKLTKVKSIFKYLSPCGTTPEGLCFEAIMKDLIPGNSNQDSYFINYSDGCPMFYGKYISYTGHAATKHTKKMTTKMTNLGIKVISYFISDGTYTSDLDKSTFHSMYGNDASFISPTNMMDVAKTMNKKFLNQ